MASRPLKIAQVLLSPRIGGAETLAASLSHSWSVDGHESCVFYLDKTTGAAKRGRLRSLRKSIRSFGPDIVLAHSAIPNVFARLATNSRVPVVTVLHSATDDYVELKLRLAERALTRRTAGVVAVSATQRDDYARRFGSRLVTVIPNGLRHDLPVKSHYSSIPKEIVSVGRIARQKNPAQWLKIAQLLGGLVPPLEFKWFGPPSDEPEIPAIIKSGEDELHAQFCSPVADPGEILAKADIFLHTASREAHSIGILEAAAVGLPIVCSDTVARTVPGIIRVYEYPDGDVVAAARVIQALILSFDTANFSAREGASKVRREFDGMRCARSYLDLFEELEQREISTSRKKRLG